MLLIERSPAERSLPGIASLCVLVPDHGACQEALRR